MCAGSLTDANQDSHSFFSSYKAPQSSPSLVEIFLEPHFLVKVGGDGENRGTCRHAGACAASHKGRDLGSRMIQHSDYFRGMQLTQKLAAESLNCLRN